MAANVEILGINATKIPLARIDNSKHSRTVNVDAEVIVKDILVDIFDTAIRKSEETQQQNLDENNKRTEYTEPETSDLIDLTRNYKQEFRNILQNLKCHTQKAQPNINVSLEDQIKNVIDEIKSLESSVRLNVQEDRGDIDIMADKNLRPSNSNPIEIKSEITDILNLNDSTHRKNHEGLYIDEEINDEIVLQVIDLEPTESEVSFTHHFLSEEELEDVNLTNEELDNTLNQGDRPQSIVVTSVLPNAEPCAGETAVPNPVPEPEPDVKLLHPEEGVRKKKSLGSRLWHFIRKSSRSASRQSVKQNDNSK